MSEQEKIKLIEELVNHYKNANDLFGGIKEYIDLAETKIWDTYWLMFDSYLETVAKIIGDDFGSISWFIWENDCGKKGFEVHFKNSSGDIKKIQVKTVEDIVEVIEAE